MAGPLEQHSNPTHGLHVLLAGTLFEAVVRHCDGYSEESTRLIFAYGFATMGDSSLAKLPNIDSIKRTIRKHKNGLEVLSNPAHASEIQIQDKYKVTSKGEHFYYMIQ